MTHKEAVILSAYTGFLLVPDPKFIGKIRTKCEPLVEEIIRDAE